MRVTFQLKSPKDIKHTTFGQLKPNKNVKINPHFENSLLSQYLIVCLFD